MKRCIFYFIRPCICYVALNLQFNKMQKIGPRLTVYSFRWKKCPVLLGVLVVNTHVRSYMYIWSSPWHFWHQYVQNIPFMILFLVFQMLERELCIRQLRYSGMMETIRIRRAGYPIRHGFNAFIDRYQYLIPQHISSFPDIKAACKHICKKILGEQSSYQIGLTKIFLKVPAHVIYFA